MHPSFISLPGSAEVSENILASAAPGPVMDMLRMNVAFLHQFAGGGGSEPDHRGDLFGIDPDGQRGAVFSQIASPLLIEGEF
jgi:hypothetical protein